MKTEKKRTFKGAVLFTVVSVMSLLIVFLTSTLVLANAANNRAHKSYSSSQANYTARAAIDSVIQAAYNDPNFAIAMNSLKAGGSFDVDVSMENSVAGIGKVDNVKIAHAGKKQFYVTTKQEWAERDIISITADVTYGGETKTVTAYVLKDPPTPGGGGGGGGGFVTVGTAGTANHTISFGGTYLGIGMSKGSRYYQGAYGLPKGQIVSLEDKLYLNRKDNQPGAYSDDPTIDYLPNNPENFTMVDIGNGQQEIENGLVTYKFGNDCTIEAPTVINGNFYSNAKTELYIPSEATGMAVWGNLHTQAGSSSFYITGNPDKINPTSFKEIPYLYVDSLFYADCGADFFVNDKQQFPLNMFCGSVNLKQSKIYADIYCQDSNKTSIISCTQNTNLYTWSKSVVTSTDGGSETFTGGNFYSKGNVIIGEGANAVTIAGDMVVEGDLEVKGKLNVTGSIAVGGTLIVNGEINVGTGHSIYAGYVDGGEESFDGVMKTQSDGVTPLFTEETIEETAVLVGQFKCIKPDGGIQDYQGAWVKQEFLTKYPCKYNTPYDENGKTKGDWYDAEWKYNSVDASLIVADANGKKEQPKEDRGEVPTYPTTIWTNTETGEVTTNKADVFESDGYIYKGHKIGKPDLYKTMHNGELFPRKAEKAVILGLEEIGDGTPVADSTVLKTVQKIEEEYDFTRNSITKIPAEGNYLADVNTNVYTNDTLPDEITTSCTLSGKFNKKINIKNTATNDIWVKLVDFELSTIGGNQANIIYDDSAPNCGNLNLYVEDKASFKTGAGIYTKTYKDLIDSNAKFQIATRKDLYLSEADGGKKVECPKINIYSKEIETDLYGNLISQPYFHMENMCIVTAAIEAPNMMFDLEDVKELNNEIYYNGRKISEASGYNRRVGVIGVLNVAEGGMTNNWVFLYTPKGMPDGDDSDDPDKVSKDFDVMYYEGF